MELVRPEVVIFIGLQGSGKSSLYRSMFSQTHTHISKDLLAKNKNNELRQQKLLENALSQNENVVLDNTNFSVDLRAALLATAKRFGATCVGYYFESKVEACLARNRLRPEPFRVPDIALFATLKKLERPSFSEGFDALFYVQMLPDTGFQLTKWDVPLP